MSGETLVKALEWLYSEAQDGKDVADCFIGTKKGLVKLWMKGGNGSVSKSLIGEHKTCARHCQR